MYVYMYMYTFLGLKNKEKDIILMTYSWFEQNK